MNDESLPSWSQCEPREPQLDVAQTWYLAGRAAALAETKPLRTTLRVWQTLGSLAACAAVWAWIPVVQRLDGDLVVRVKRPPATELAASVNPNPEPAEIAVAALRPVERSAEMHDSESIAVRNRTIARRRMEESHVVFDAGETNSLRFGSREELERSSL